MKTCREKCSQSFFRQDSRTSGGLCQPGCSNLCDFHLPPPGRVEKKHLLCHGRGQGFDQLPLNVLSNPMIL